ncbi:MAG: exonuclease domain-containing protein [Thermoleophilia bacterium]
MSDRLCALIERRGRPLEVGHIAAQLLHLRGCPETLQRRLVAQIVESDLRLAWHGRDLVGLAPPEWAERDVRDGSFCVVDLETTGGSPGRARITELGAVRVEGMRITAEYSTLVNPGHAIPAAIVQLNGIDDETVAGAPPIDDVLLGFIEFARDDVLVAHNAPFDLRFLNHERRRLDGTYFTQPWLDTLTMARRLLRGRAGRNDLGNLAAWADTTVRPSHRALPDAAATAELLVRFLDMLVDEGVTTLERAVAFAAPGGTRHSWKLALADDLPSAPGVYRMLDRRGGVLYVGKAGNLRRRVRSYFGPGGQHSTRIGRVLEQLDRIEYEQCESELDALLLESSRIREHQPPGNRRGVGRRPGGRLAVIDGDWARVASSGAAGRTLVGGISPKVAASMRTLFEQLYPIRACAVLCPPDAGFSDSPRPCAGPCGRDDAAMHADAVASIERLAGPVPAEALGALAIRLVDSARAGRWNPGDTEREQLGAALAALRGEWRAKAATRRCAVIVEPSDVRGVAVLFGVMNGAVVLRRRLDSDALDAGLPDVLEELARAAEPAEPDVETARLLEQRIRDRGVASTVVVVSADRWLDGAVRARVARVARDVLESSSG